MVQDFKETNNYPKRLSRYSSVGKEVGKFATRFLINTVISDNKSETVSYTHLRAHET